MSYGFRTQHLFETLHNLIRAFPYGQAQNEHLIELLNKIRSQYRLISSLLKLSHIRYELSDSTPTPNYNF
jgi:hypothetical protein